MRSTRRAWCSPWRWPSPPPASPRHHRPRRRSRSACALGTLPQSRGPCHPCIRPKSLAERRLCCRSGHCSPGKRLPPWKAQSAGQWPARALRHRPLQRARASIRCGTIRGPATGRSTWPRPDRRGAARPSSPQRCRCRPIHRTVPGLQGRPKTSPGLGRRGGRGKGRFEHSK